MMIIDAPAVISAAWGEWQGGQGLGGRASLWAWTPQSRIDLHPPSASTSQVLGMSATEQVGYSTEPVFRRAALWRGSAASYVSLHPSNAAQSEALATDGVNQGGYASLPSPGGGTAWQAILWHGSATNYTSLSPGPGYSSQLSDIVPGQQVGSASAFGGSDHAALWRGTPESFVDLNPPGAGYSGLTATCGTTQAGVADVAGIGGTAGVWFGTPESFIALEPFLPSGYAGSVATSIAEIDGRLFVGGHAVNLATQEYEAFLWIGVPAPGTGMAILGMICIAAARRRRTATPAA
jgi:hypothetical protein